MREIQTLLHTFPENGRIIQAFACNEMAFLNRFFEAVEWPLLSNGNNSFACGRNTTQLLSCFLMDDGDASQGR